MVQDNYDFIHRIQHLLDYIDANCKSYKITCSRDVERLYTGFTADGYMTPLRAVYNLKQSFCVLGIVPTYSRNMEFKELIEYAKNKLNDYSIFACGRTYKVIMLPVFVKSLTFGYRTGE